MRQARCVDVREYVRPRMTRYDSTAYLSTYQAENAGGFIFLKSKTSELKTSSFLTPPHGPPRTPRTLLYLSSAQQVLAGEPHENIRKPIIAILTLNSHM